MLYLEPPATNFEINKFLFILQVSIMHCLKYSFWVRFAGDDVIFRYLTLKMLTTFLKGLFTELKKVFFSLGFLIMDTFSK